jgi:hypothetical protein
MKLLPEHKPALAAAEKVLKKLSSTDCGELVDSELHGFIDDLQLQLVDVHAAIVDTWFTPGE